MNVQLGINTVKGLEALLRGRNIDTVGIITGNSRDRTLLFKVLRKLGLSDGVFTDIPIVSIDDAKNTNPTFWEKDLIIFNPDRVITRILKEYNENTNIIGMYINTGSNINVDIEISEPPVEKSGTVYKANLEHNLCIMKDHNIFDFCGIPIPEEIKTGEEVITKIDLKVTAVFGDNGCLADNLNARLLMPDCVFEPIVIKNEEDGVIDIVNGYMDKNYVVHFSNCSRTAFCVHIVGEIYTEPAK